MSFTRAEVCAAAAADAFRADGEVLASCFGAVPGAGARLARLTFAPDLLMTDGVCTLLANTPPLSGAPQPPVAEGWTPFRFMFDHLWNGRRHVIMTAVQIDAHGNQNFACIGEHAAPKAQLLGMRGAPGNTISHRTSYWVPKHGPKVFVPKVDCVSGVGYNRAHELGAHSARFHNVHRVISNLGVFDFETPEGRMRLRSLHPGVSADEVAAATGFELVIPQNVPQTRAPTEAELELLRGAIDPEGLINKEVPE